jgi:hypothetical protein
MMGGSVAVSACRLRRELHGLEQIRVGGYSERRRSGNLS